MKAYEALPLMAAAGSLLVGAYVMLREPGQRTNRLFLCMAFALAAWGFGEYFMRTAAVAPTAELGANLAAAGWCLIGAFFLDFSYALRAERLVFESRVVILSAYSVGFAFLLLTWATGLVFKTFIPHPHGGYVEVSGVLRFPSRMMVAGLVLLGVTMLLRDYRRASGEKRTALALAGVAASIPLLTGLFTDILLPVLGVNPPVSSQAAMPVTAVLAAVAITRYDLLESVSGFLGGSIISKIHEAVLVADSDGLIETVNPAAEELTGRDRTALVRMQISELFSGAPLLLEPSTSPDERVRCLCSGRDGQAIPVAVTRETVRRRTGGNAGCVLVVHDLRDEIKLMKAEREAEAAAAAVEAERDRSQALRRSREQFLQHSSFLQNVIDSIAAPLWIKDAELRFVFVNRAFCELSGLAREVPIGWSGIEAIGRAGGLRSSVNDHLSFTRREVVEDEEVYGSPDGSQRTVRSTRVPLLDDSGRPEHLICVFNDITEQKRLDSARLEFIRVAAHELRTPLTSLKLGLDMLARETRGSLNRDQQRSLDVLSLSVERLGTLAGNLLDLAGLEAGLLTMDRGPVDMRALIEEVAESFAAACAEKGLYCRVRLDETLEPANADPAKVSQVLYNLLGNAVKFTMSGGVTVSARQAEDGFLEVCVSDTGPGINPERQRSVFAAFESGGRPDAGRDGTGLGLPISKAIVEAHDGRLWVDSVPGEGSRFHFTVRTARAAGGGMEGSGR